MLQEFHIHTTFGDGSNSPEELILAAIDMGYVRIGFSDHSYTWFDETWCMSLESTALYREKIFSLKEKYLGKIDVLCGIEQDYYSDESTRPYDYAIGSVHYVRCGRDYLPIDESPQLLRSAAENYFGGDYYALAEAYYENVKDIVGRTNCDYIGHFDIISKFNESERFFDESNPRYINAWKAAADELLKYERPFEINTGAMSHGYRSCPYPSPDIFGYLRSNGAKFIFSSDCHDVKNLGFGRSEVEKAYGITFD